MAYYSNGGFNWSDIYYMPIKLREFYWRELLNAKSEENKKVQEAKSPKGNTPSKSSKVRRR